MLNLESLLLLPFDIQMNDIRLDFKTQSISQTFRQYNSTFSIE